jgi:dolichyl-phosphate-mannose-protein mannosyltransferase
VLLAAGLRFWDLGTPDRLLFDENFYARDACLFVNPPSVCEQPQAFTQEHPVGAKWLIAAGIDAFGYEPFGWRFASALAGTAGVAIVFLLGRRILASTWAGFGAASLLALDFLHFELSRLAMLDIFVATFGSAAVLFAVLDRDRAGPPGSEARRDRLRDRPWLLAAGAALGAAVASKWSGGLFIPAVAAAVVWWDAIRQQGRGRVRSVVATLGREWFVLAVALVAVPLLIYVVSFGDRLDGTLLAAPWDRDSWWWDLARRQVVMVREHLAIKAEHGYASPAWSWPLVKRPVNIAWEDGEGVTRHILGFGNPLAWWPAVLTIGWIAIRWLRGRRGPSNPEGVILLGITGSFLPWLLLTNVRSFTFLFYVLPAVPFMSLALAWGLQRLATTSTGRAVAAGAVAIVLAAFVFFFPILTARPLSDDAWLTRIWFRSCPNALVEEGVPRPSFEPYPPPPGWCWI